MICSKCGAKLKKGSNYCHICGTPQLVSTPAEVTAQRLADAARKKPAQAVAKKSKKRAYLVIFCIIILMAMIITPTVLVITNPAMDVARALGKDDFAATAEIFGTKIKGDTLTQKAAFAAVSAYVENQRVGYISEEIDFDTASANISAVAAMNVIDEQITHAALSYVQRLNISRTAWQAAEAAFAAQDYVTAIAQYALVTDVNYSNAQEKLTQAKDAYREQILAQVNTLTDAQSFDAAAALINQALAVLPEDGRLQQRLSYITDGKNAETLTAILEAATTQASQRDYKGAFDTLSDAKSVYGEDALYKEKLLEIQNICRTDTLAQAQAASAETGAKAAADIVEGALILLPNDAELTKALETYRAQVAVSSSSTTSSSKAA